MSTEPSRRYTPELGQVVFGNRWDTYECPEWFVALLEALGTEIERITHNNDPDDVRQPMANSGTELILSEFEARSYCWEDCICEDSETINEHCRACKSNFHYGNLEVRWYKHLGRGTSINKSELRPEEGVAIFRDCLEAVRRTEMIYPWRT